MFLDRVASDRSQSITAWSLDPVSDSPHDTAASKAHSTTGNESAHQPTGRYSGQKNWSDTRPPSSAGRIWTVGIGPSGPMRPDSVTDVWTVESPP
jgi:hypothetical protein